MASISSFYEKVTKYDLSLIFISLFLVVLGIINLNSATTTSTIVGVPRLFKMQIMYIVIGFIIMLIVTFVDYRRYERFIYPFYLFNIFLLIVVLVVGKKISGSSRWISLGFMNFQPSELMKISIILTFAKFFNYDSQVGSYSLKDLLIPFTMAAVPALLIIVEPDLGSGMVLLLISFSIFLFVRINSKSLIFLVVLALTSAPLAYTFLLKDYQRKRVLTFVDPSSDPRGSGYNSLQSKIAVGSGQIFGKGFKKGTQSQLNFLPEHHTDFIFSVLAEEHGFIGAVLVLLLFTLLMMSGIRIASKAKDKFGVILCVGCTAMLFWHCMVNIGMVIGIMPIVGVALPFFSYGGSSMLVSFLCIGFMQSVAIRRFMF